MSNGARALPGSDEERIARGVLAGNRFLLSRAITLVESTRADHRISGREILEVALQEADVSAKPSIRIGISGPPGVGKSSFIEAAGKELIKRGRKVAVVCVDPTSVISRGSILGDKTRMNYLSAEPNAFIRPCSNGLQMGGLAQHTDEVVMLCEAAGYDTVLIETVGVGQSEILVNEVSDMFLLLLPPGGGDELQGIKKGIVESADLIAINKADGDLLMPAKRAQGEYQAALMALRGNSKKRMWWTPEVLTCSAKIHKGIEEVLDITDKFREKGTDSGELALCRGTQRASWMWRKAEESLMQMLRAEPAVQELAKTLEDELRKGKRSSRWAASELVGTFFAHNRLNDPPQGL